MVLWVLQIRLFQGIIEEILTITREFFLACSKIFRFQLSFLATCLGFAFALAICLGLFLLPSLATCLGLFLCYFLEIARWTYWIFPLVLLAILTYFIVCFFKVIREGLLPFLVFYATTLLPQLRLRHRGFTKKNKIKKK